MEPQMMPPQGGQPQQPQQGKGMPSEEEIMMAGMIALGLVPPPGQGQPGQPPMQGQQQPGGGASARIAQQLMG